MRKETPLERPPLVQNITRRERVQLNPDLVEKLQKSYCEDGDIELWLGEGPESQEIIKQGTIFAKRTGTSFRFRFGKKDGKPYMTFRICPKKPYTRSIEAKTGGNE